MILRTSDASPCRSSGCDPPPACVVSRLASMGAAIPAWLVGCQRAPCHGAASRLSAISSNAPTTSDPSVPSSPQNDPSDTYPACRHESFQEVSRLEKKYRTSRAGDLDDGVQIIYFKALRTKASRHVLIRGSQPPDFTPPSPQPCQA
jgi:hypothetical protein